MSTTYQTLYQKVHLRLNSAEGRALLFAKEAVNDAHKWIARVKDFDELLEWDTTNALLVVGQEAYDLTEDWPLTRAKDIYSLIYYTTNSSSSKIYWMDPQEYDEKYPYPAAQGNGDPEVYTQKGIKVYLHPPPATAYTCRVYYSQWPLVLSSDSDQTSYTDLDDVIVALAYDIARANLSGSGVTDWTSRANNLLKGGVLESITKPDQRYIARPFRSGGRSVGQYWLNPMVKENP